MTPVFLPRLLQPSRLCPEWDVSRLVISKGEHTLVCILELGSFDKSTYITLIYCSFLVFSERMFTCLCRLIVNRQDQALQMTFGFVINQFLQCLEMAGNGFPRILRSSCSICDAGLNMSRALGDVIAHKEVTVADARSFAFELDFLNGY